MRQSEVFYPKYQITLLSDVPRGQPVTRYRPEADSNSVREVPKTPDSFLKEKEMNSQKEKWFSFSNMCAYQL